MTCPKITNTQVHQFIPQTPYERLETWLDQESLTKLERQKTSTNPITAMNRLKKAARNIFGYFKDSIKQQERGKILR